MSCQICGGKDGHHFVDCNKMVGVLQKDMINKAEDGVLKMYETNNTFPLKEDGAVVYDISKESTTQEKIDTLFYNFKEFLKEKNIRYGDSALNPLQIFPINDPEILELCVRANDKCSRIKNSKEGLRRSDVCDLFGYISLIMIKKGWLKFDEEID